MMRISGPSHKYCDGATRRSFLQVGSLAVGGLSLADLFAAEAASKTPTQVRHKSVIMVYLSGGMPHQDTFDLKPEPK